MITTHSTENRENTKVAGLAAAFGGSLRRQGSNAGVSPILPSPSAALNSSSPVLTSNNPLPYTGAGAFLGGKGTGNPRITLTQPEKELKLKIITATGVSINQEHEQEAGIPGSQVQQQKQIEELLKCVVQHSNKAQSSLLTLQDTMFALWTSERGATMRLAKKDSHKDETAAAFEALVERADQIRGSMKQLAGVHGKFLKELRVYERIEAPSVFYQRMADKFVALRKVAEGLLGVGEITKLKGEMDRFAAENDSDQKRKPEEPNDDFEDGDVGFIASLYNKFGSSDEQKVIDDLQSRIRQRDEYLQSTIFETAKQVHSLEQYISELENENNELKRDIDDSQSEEQAVNETNDFQVQVELQSRQEQEKIMLMEKEIKDLEKDKSRLQSDLGLLRLQKTHLEVISKERDAIINDLMAQKRKSVLFPLSPLSPTGSVIESDQNRKARVRASLQLNRNSINSLNLKLSM